MNTGGIIALVSLAAAIVLALVLGLRRVLRACPAESALIVSGGRHTYSDGVERGYRVVTSGHVLVRPLLERADVLPLHAITVDLVLGGVLTREGDALELRGTAVIRPIPREPHIHLAIERFLGLAPRAVAEVAAEVLAHATRSCVESLDTAEARAHLEMIAARAMATARPDLQRMGLEATGLDFFQVTAS